jgi:hypothetical protein
LTFLMVVSTHKPFFLPPDLKIKLLRSFVEQDAGHGTGPPAPAGDGLLLSFTDQLWRHLPQGSLRPCWPALGIINCIQHAAASSLSRPDQPPQYCLQQHLDPLRGRRRLKQPQRCCKVGIGNYPTYHRRLMMMQASLPSRDR